VIQYGTYCYRQGFSSVSGYAWIRIVFESWIRNRIKVKSYIRMRIKVKIQEL
jgi:hypothetical protein